LSLALVIHMVPSPNLAETTARLRGWTSHGRIVRVDVRPVSCRSPRRGKSRAPMASRRGRREPSACRVCSGRRYRHVQRALRLARVGNRTRVEQRVCGRRWPTTRLLGGVALVNRSVRARCAIVASGEVLDKDLQVAAAPPSSPWSSAWLASPRSPTCATAPESWHLERP
jgi:hypothetical protein